MAGVAEMGLSIAQVVAHGSAPDPLEVTFKGQTLDDGAAIVFAIIRECGDASVGLKEIRMDPILRDHIVQLGYDSSVPLSARPDLIGSIQVFAAGREASA